MKKGIREQRTGSVLKELIGEAIGQLRDERVSSLGVVRVEVSSGRSNATVYMDSTGIDESKKKRLIAQLRKARGYIGRYCLSVENWRRMPDLEFVFDEEAAQAHSLEKIFEAIGEKKE